MNTAPNATTLRITEIFRSLQGETRDVGLPTVLVRLTGCPLRCTYCDTAYAFTGGASMSLDRIQARVAAEGGERVTVTGGEPLAQPGCVSLLGQLADAGYAVSLETSGALDTAGVDPRVVTVLDLKTPGSGECHRNHWANVAHLRSHDQVKFVVRDRSDYEWARMKLAEHDLADRAGEVLLSPSWGELEPGRLADWALADRLPVRVQIQLHKVLWGDVPGR